MTKLDLDAIEQAAKAFRAMGSNVARLTVAASPDDVLALVAIARAANAFVDDQGKYVNARNELDASDNFAADLFHELARALDGAGL